LFPTKKYYIKLTDDRETTLHRLEKNTKKSHRFNLSKTKKPFLGIIDGHAFKLICPQSRFGTLCIMDGKIHENEIHVIFKFRSIPKLIMLIYIFIFSLTFISHIFKNSTEIFSNHTLGLLSYVLMLIFVLPKMLFIMASRKCLKILQKTLKVHCNNLNSQY